MSDPVANVDIEDVLSSIRRLVSNGPEKSDLRAQEAREGDRLVLTPSQRVDDDGVEDDGVDGGGEPVDAASGSESVASAGLTEAHPPGLDLSPEPEPDTAERDASGHGLDDDPETDTDTELEAAIAAFSLDKADEAHGTPENAVADTGASEDREGAGGRGEADSEDPALAGIAAMFARHEAATPSAWEPDGDDEDAFSDQGSAPTLDWRDIDETDEDGLYEQDPGGTGHANGGQGQERNDRADARDLDAEARAGEDNAFAIEHEAVLDEEALRDLVAEIVREELMGTLGERITRNVRKLVRREIHRALNSQDFD